MHPINVRLHHFFVPHRLIWERAGGTGTFEDFITAGSDGADAQTVPTMPSTGVASDLLDYYGVPPIAGVNVSALPVTGFNAVFNEYFRDQDLVPERADQEKTVPRCAWEKDYLTSARPWPQKGPDVTLPIAGKAPVTGIGMATQTYTAGGASRYETGATGSTTFANEIQGATNSYTFAEDPDNPGFPGIFADLSQTDAVKVNELRRALALQRFQEARARWGSRYTEYLRYLGITPSDARLDRPEYLGGGTVRLAVSEVLQTAPEGATPARDYGVGDMYGHGVAAVRANAYQRFFEEHGYVHTVMSVRPHAMYLQGIDRTWLRKVHEDFHQRELEHIGQQEIWNNEAYADPTTGEQTFGYQDRYRDYREAQSKVSGEFRQLLNYWHLGRDFTVQPVLNQSFVECDPSKRIFNEQTQHSLWIQVQHRLVARRMLSARASGRIL